MKYQDITKYKYRLFCDEQFTLPFLLPDFEGKMIDIVHGVMIVRAGYLWDGPSGPTYDSQDVLRASLAHDALYELMRRGIIDQVHKKNADDYYHKLMINAGVSPLRARVHLLGLRRFGKGSSKVQPSTKPKVKEI